MRRKSELLMFAGISARRETAENPPQTAVDIGFRIMKSSTDDAIPQRTAQAGTSCALPD